MAFFEVFSLRLRNARRLRRAASPDGASRGPPAIPPNGVSIFAVVKMLRPFESRILGKVRKRPKTKNRPFSATRSPIDARFVASDGKSKPALDRRNGFFNFDPRNLWGAKWGVLHFSTKCACLGYYYNSSYRNNFHLDNKLSYCSSYLKTW
jgi:hypothetical protein